MICERCKNKVAKDDIILLVKSTDNSVIDVMTCCRGTCHDLLELEQRVHGYSCGFYEMNTGLKDVVLEYEELSNYYEPKVLEKYKQILRWCNS